MRCESERVLPDLDGPTRYRPLGFLAFGLNCMMRLSCLGGSREVSLSR